MINEKLLRGRDFVINKDFYKTFIFLSVLNGLNSEDL